MPPSSPLSLDALIARDDVPGVRAYLDRALLGEKVQPPQWPQLRNALERRNLDMMRLLVTWGAQPTAPELGRFLALRGEHKDEDAKLLRLAGVSPDLLAAAAASRKKTLPEMPPERIPEQWRRVLSAFQKKAHAPEAMLVGYSVYHAFEASGVGHSAPVFALRAPLAIPSHLQSRLSLLNKAFRAAGQKPDFRRRTVKAQNMNGQTVEEWHFSDQHARGQIVYFVSGPIADEWHKASKKMAKNSQDYDLLQRAFIESITHARFQIGFDGERAIIGTGYKPHMKSR